jgi:hypothetical protein
MVEKDKVRLFNCSDCNKSFTQQAHLSIHQVFFVKYSENTLERDRMFADLRDVPSLLRSLEI